MHGVDEYGDMLRIDIRRDAVAEVEHVSWTFAETVEGDAHLFADGLRIGGKRGWIEIALQGDTVTDAPACF